MDQHSIIEFEDYLQNGKIIFLYDGVQIDLAIQFQLTNRCNLCYGTVKFFYNRNPSKFEFINLQSIIKNQQLVETFKIPTDLDAVTIIKGTQNLVQTKQNQFQKPFRILYKSQAIQECLKELKYPWYLLGVIIQLIPLVIKDLGYDIVGRFRYKLFGKSQDICQINKKNK